MPGRAKTTIAAEMLDIYDPLVEELRRKGYTIKGNSQVTVSFLAPYTSVPSSDIGGILRRLERDIAINGSRKVGKGDLCKILGISLPTLNSWICKYWYDAGLDWRDHRNRWYYHKIDLDEVKNQLSKMTLQRYEKAHKSAKKPRPIRYIW